MFFLISLPLLFLSPVISNAQNENDCFDLTNKRAIKFYDKAIHEYKRNNYLEANRLMKSVLDIEPECVDAYYVLAMINVKKIKYNVIAANRYFLKVIELCEDYDIDAFYWLGSISYGADKWDEAIKYLNIYLKDVTLIDDDEKFTDARAMLEYAKVNLKFYKNSVPFNPNIVKDISTRADEYLPIISADGLIAFFTRRIHVAAGKNDLIKGTKVKEVFSFSEKKNGKFGVGQPMPFPFNQTDNEGGATITIDNELLYYSVAKLENGYLNTDIYVSENIDGYWSDGEPINGDSVNLFNTWDTQPTISSDGKTLYFVSDRPGCLGGKGDYDIYVTKKDEKGVWCKPENLGPTINTKGREKSPFIHSDNKTLYFASEGWGGLGGYDIYYSRLDQDGKRTEPKNIGYPINTADDETSFFVSTNGKYAFFASTKYNSTGGWDLFYFNLYEEARPEKVLLLKGELKDKKTDEPIKARIELKNVDTKKITEIPVDSFSGKYATVVSFENDYIMTIKKRGYAYESRYIANVDSVIDEPVNMDIEIKEIEVGESYKLNDIYFATNSYELTPESNIVIDGFIEFLEENYTVDVAIHGYTDNVGSSESNLILSENRAQAVYNYLLENGINGNRLSYRGLGEEQPVASNENSAGRAKNRRTVFIVVNK